MHSYCAVTSVTMADTAFADIQQSVGMYNEMKKGFKNFLRVTQREIRI